MLFSILLLQVFVLQIGLSWSCIGTPLALRMWNSDLAHEIDNVIHERHEIRTNLVDATLGVVATARENRGREIDFLKRVIMDSGDYKKRQLSKDQGMNVVMQKQLDALGAGFMSCYEDSIQNLYFKSFGSMIAKRFSDIRKVDKQLKQEQIKILDAKDSPPSRETLLNNDVKSSIAKIASLVRQIGQDGDHAELASQLMAEIALFEQRVVVPRQLMAQGIDAKLNDLKEMKGTLDYLVYAEMGNTQVSDHLASMRLCMRKQSPAGYFSNPLDGIGVFDPFLMKSFDQKPSELHVNPDPTESIVTSYETIQSILMALHGWFGFFFLKKQNKYAIMILSILLPFLAVLIPLVLFFIIRRHNKKKTVKHYEKVRREALVYNSMTSAQIIL